MKKIKLLLMLFSIFSLLCLGSACDMTNTSSIEVTGPIVNEGIILKNSELSGLKVKAIYDDDTFSNEVDVTSDMITGYDKTKTGTQTITVNYMDMSYDMEIFVADKIIEDATQLRDALKNQKDGECWGLKSGIFDIDRQFIDFDTCTYINLSANNLTICGVNGTILTSTKGSVNGNWCDQDFIFVSGENVTLCGLEFVSKREVNKVIEVTGDNFKMYNCKICPPTESPKYAGSIYFQNFAGKSAEIEDVVLNYGRIATTGCNTESVIVLKNVDINFAGAEGYDEEYSPNGYDYETNYYGFSNSTNADVIATNCTITVSNEFYQSDSYENFLSNLPTGMAVNTIDVSVQ